MAYKQQKGKRYESKSSLEVKNYFLKGSSINILSGKSGNNQISWRKNSKANGYEIQYSTKRKILQRVKL